MNEVAIFRQMKNIAKGDLEDNEEFVMLKDYKDLKQQLQLYKDKEDKLREYIQSPNFLEWYLGDIGGEYQQEILLQILNEGGK